MRTEEGKGIDSSIQAKFRSGMEGMESEDGGILVRKSVEGAIVFRDVCKDGSKTKGGEYRFGKMGILRGQK